MRLIILGGGFLGQVLHVLLPRARVLDWAPVAPTVPMRQIGPQYLWEPIPELVCPQFDVWTTVDGVEATETSIRAYKEKVGKAQDGADWRAQFRPWMSGWDCHLPISRVEYGKRIISINVAQHRLTIANGDRVDYDMLLNTIPLPRVMALCGQTADAMTFRFKPIYIECDYTQPREPAMRVNYLSSPSLTRYRQTLRNGVLYSETLDVLPHFAVKILPGKIYACDRTEASLTYLALHNIFCFGRYATWTSDELAHETVHRARVFKKGYDL